MSKTRTRRRTKISPPSSASSVASQQNLHPSHAYARKKGRRAIHQTSSAQEYTQCDTPVNPNSNSALQALAGDSFNAGEDIDALHRYLNIIEKDLVRLTLDQRRLHTRMDVLEERLQNRSERRVVPNQCHLAPQLSSRQSHRPQQISAIQAHYQNANLSGESTVIHPSIQGRYRFKFSIYGNRERCVR